MLIFPAAFLAVTLFCFNFIGDGLRGATGAAPNALRERRMSRPRRTKLGDAMVVELAP
jgi:hypothetical protein